MHVWGQPYLKSSGFSQSLQIQIQIQIADVISMNK
jgi:hypothetical protein